MNRIRQHKKDLIAMRDPDDKMLALMEILGESELVPERPGAYIHTCIDQRLLTSHTMNILWLSSHLLSSGDGKDLTFIGEDLETTRSQKCQEK